MLFMKKIFRAKDFYMMEVRDTLGRKLGILSGLSLDISKQQVDGFCLHSRGLKNEIKKINMEDVIAFNEFMIVKATHNKGSLNFNKLRGMEVYDLQSNLLGKIEEMLFNIVNFKLIAIILTTGLIKDVVKGKRLLLTENLIIGEKSILLMEKNEKIKFFSRIHSI